MFLTVIRVAMWQMIENGKLTLLENSYYCKILRKYTVCAEYKLTDSVLFNV